MSCKLSRGQKIVFDDEKEASQKLSSIGFPCKQSVAPYWTLKTDEDNGGDDSAEGV